MHLVSHGRSGEIALGNAILSGTNLDHYRTALGEWANAFNADADLLIYGCQFAA